MRLRPRKEHLVHLDKQSTWLEVRQMEMLAECNLMLLGMSWGRPNEDTVQTNSLTSSSDAQYMHNEL